jgi:hypothetical protein
VISHGIAKEKEVPKKEINAAIARMEKFKKNPTRHTFQYTSRQQDQHERDEEDSS